MRNFARTILKSESLTGTVLVTAALLANSFFSYLLQVFLARHFSVADFGTYNALLSFFAIMGVPIMVLSSSLVKVISDLSGRQERSILTQLFWKSMLFLFLSGIAIIFILILLKDILSDYMNIGDSALYLYLGVYIAGSLLSVGPQAFMQGLMRFKAFSLYVANMGVIRLIIPSVVVLLGYGVGGVYLGLGLSMLICTLIGFLIMKKNLVDLEKKDLTEEYKKIISFTMPLLILNLGMMSLNNIDVILVKKYFDAMTAGYYAGVVILGKIILFGAGSITIVMFPQISSLVSAKKSYLKKFWFFLWLQLTALAAGILAFSLAPNLIAKIFFGQQLLVSAQYLPLFSIFISMHVLINFILMFFIAINKTKASLVLVPAVLAQFVLISAWHSSIFSVITINIAITLIILASLTFYLYKITNSSAR